jgi:hypothetical protein
MTRPLNNCDNNTDNTFMRLQHCLAIVDAIKQSSGDQHGEKLP